MSSIDDRIVQMKFDNQDFEKKAATTTQTIKRLDESLNFKNSGAGLRDVGNSLSTLTPGFNSIASSVESVAQRFSIMGAVAFSVIDNIVDRAVNAGIRIGKALSLEQVIAGFNEYETNINSVQTILANTSSQGTDLEQVTASLDELNYFADKTIYNFSQMARAVGTFTAAGVELDTSVQAIKGIANLAAISGSSPEQAASAYYQLSQALANNRVALIDWISVVNAGLGGEIFKKVLFETGKALGTLEGVGIDTTFEEWEAAGNKFRESLNGTGQKVETEAEKAARASEESSKIISEAEQSAADAVKNANDRVVDARKYQAETFKNTTEAIEQAVKDQQKVIERNAQDIEKAFDDVVKARERLEEAMKPSSEDDLEEASDRVKTAQLDQADVARALDDAFRDQTRASQDLAKAQKRFQEVISDPSSSLDEINAAGRAVEDAQVRVEDLADASERARIRQRDAARNLKDAEEDLNKAKEKGSETDENVINAQKDLETAEENLVKIKEQALENERLAIERIAEVSENARKRQEQAAENLSRAEEANARIIVQSQEQVAEAYERAALAAETISNAGQPPTWLTGDVLTTALSVFTGDLTKEQLLSIGYSEKQADEFINLGQTAVDASTKVKTFSQTMSTLKEAISSGWAQSFRLIFGDFEEAKGLFTSVSDALGSVAASSSDARNELLSKWKDLGGRIILIEAFENAWDGLRLIFKAVKSAFQTIFPPLTADKLLELTKRFRDFTEKLKLGSNYINLIWRIARGFFSAIKIGIEIIKGIVKVIGDLFDRFNSFDPTNETGILGFIAKFVDKIYDLKVALVDGKGIEEFFANFSEGLSNLLDNVSNLGLLDGIKEVLSSIIDGILGLFGASGFSDNVKSIGIFKAIGEAVDDLEGSISGRLGPALETISTIFENVVEFLSDVWEGIKKIANGIAQVFVDIFEESDYNKFIDTLNTSLLGGLVGLLAGFVTSGLKLDFGKDLLTSIKDTLGELTDTLAAMQAEIKSNAILKIAAGVALLTASVVVLSMIDSAALTKGLTALAVGLGQLVGAVALLSAIDFGSRGVFKVAALTVTLFVLSASMLLLSFAIKSLSSLDLAELAKGLAGIAGAMLVLAGGLKLLSGISGGLVRAGIAMIGIAIAMNILAVAVKIFATMEWSEMLRGLTGIGIALGVVVLAMNKLPPNMFLSALGVVAIAGAMNLLATAVFLFGSMNIETMVKGLAGIGAGLYIIVLAVKAMPANMALIGIGLLAIGVGLTGMAIAVRLLGGMSWQSLIKGLGGLAVVLGLLAAAAYAMSGSFTGAAAIAVMAISLRLLADAVVQFGRMKFKDLLKGLAGFGIVLLALVVASSAVAPVTPAILALGAALTLVAAAFAIFGAGVYLLGAGLKLVADAGVGAIKVIIEAVIAVGKVLPDLATALGEAIISLIGTLLEAAPGFVTKLGEVLDELLNVVIEILPKLGELIKELIGVILGIIQEKTPDIIAAGFQLLLDLLRGIRDNIGEVTNTVIDIILEFLGALTARIEELVKAGLEFLSAFLRGIAENISLVAGAVFSIITAFGEEIVNYIDDILELGVKFLKIILEGIVESVEIIGDALEDLITVLADEFIDLIETGGKKTREVLDAGVAFIKTVLDGILESTVEIADAMFEFVTGVLNGLAEVVRDRSDELRDAGGNLAGAILDGMTFGIAGKVKSGVGGLFGVGKSIGGGIIGGAKSILGINSPSKVFIGIGQGVIEGFVDGLKDDKPAVNTINRVGTRLTDAFNKTISNMSRVGVEIDTTPTITPVLDLSEVIKESGKLNNILGNHSLALDAAISFDQAALLASLSNRATESTEPTTSTEIKEIKFEQTIYSPTELNASEIYRQTRSQLTLAKEELQVA